MTLIEVLLIIIGVTFDVAYLVDLVLRWRKKKRGNNYL